MVTGPQTLSSVKSSLSDHDRPGSLQCQEGIDNYDSHGQFVVIVMATTIIFGLKVVVVSDFQITVMVMGMKRL